MNMAMFQENASYSTGMEGFAVVAGIIGLSIIVFSRGTVMVIVALLIIVMSAIMVQDGFHRELEKQFVLESFDKGETIECTLYRGEQIRLGLSRGWHREGEHFIKEDQVFSDPLLCSVLTKEPPKPILWVVWIFYGLYVLIAFSGRAWMSDRRKNEEAENIKGIDHD